MNKRKIARHFLVFLVVVFSFLPVLSAEKFSQPVYDVVEELDVKVAMRDGVRLSTNIYRPDAPGRFPVLLMRTPYGNGGPGDKYGLFFAGRGYAVVLQDTRGRYESEGAFDPFRNEASDGYDTQQWVGTQAWSNGKIGTVGGSYVGITQWLPAPLGSPYLVAMMPVVTVSDAYIFLQSGGVFPLRVLTSWSFYMTVPYDFDMEELTSRLDEINMSLPLIEQDRHAGWKVLFLRDWLSHPEKDLFWEKASIKGNFAAIKASVLNVGGWYDPFIGGTIDNFVGMTSSDIDPEIRAGQKLLIGPWSHGVFSVDGKLGELDFGETSKTDMRELTLRWLDSRLKGMDTGIMDEPPVKIFVMGENLWRYESEWPLARTDYRKYYFASSGNANTLNGDGSLSTRPPEGKPADRFVYDPENPVPSRADGAYYDALATGPHDQRPIEQREDVLVYSTPPLERDLEVTGPVEVVIYAASSAENTDFTAKLVDVHPGGRAFNLCEGIIRASYREGFTDPSNIEPGRVYEYHIDLVATSNVFDKGHRIRVEISSSNFPRFDRNLNTGRNFATDTTWVKAEQSVYHSREYPSCIVLPVIE